MKHRFILSWFLLLGLACNSQEACETSFVKDTLFIPMESKTMAGEYLEAVLKNRSVVRLYKLSNNRYFIKLIVTENLYFDKVDQLEIKSGSKSSYEPKIKQYELDKATGYYVFEVFKNYIGTLKDDGMTGIVFGTAKTNFTRQDANQIREIAQCFYNTIAPKKK